MVKYRTTQQPTPRLLYVKALYSDKTGRTVGEFYNLYDAKLLAIQLLETDKDVVRTKVTRDRRRLVEYKRNFLGRVKQI